jgi:hypothetical protein
MLGCRERTRKHFVPTRGQELTLRSALSDPLIRTVMAADNVDRGELEAMLLRIAEEMTPDLPTDADCA